MIANRIKLFILSRLAFIPFIIAKIVLLPVKIFCVRKSCQHDNQNVILCIEAGIQGWESIEFKELYQSGVEYIGQKKVIKLKVDKDQDYISQIKNLLTSESVTHYLYDPRTGSQSFFRGIYQSLKIALLFYRFNVTPIVFLTDLSVRTWRCQAAVVSVKTGVVVSFMSSERVQPIFPHKRLIGPSLMPFSAKTLNYLDSLSASENKKITKHHIRFAGSLYEPRISFLNKVKELLASSGHDFEILGRVVGSPRISDEKYWERLSSAIILTTADQMQQKGTDWTWVSHLIYRYLEVLSAGGLLMAPSVPGVSRYFVPGIHFVAFTTAEDAAAKASYYINHPDEANIIAKAGHDKASHLVRANSFWLQIDTALGCKTVSP